MAGINFPALRSLVTMTEVLEQIGWLSRLKGSESQQRGPCPLHESSANSRVFSVHLSKKVFRCFGCGAAGNHLDLYAAVTRQDLYQAALDLCTLLRIDPPRPSGVPWPHGTVEEAPSPALGR